VAGAQVVPLRQRVVEVEAVFRTGPGKPYRYGSGFRVHKRLVLTAAHVVTGDAAEITVRGPDKVSHSARVLEIAGDADLALLELCDQVPELPAPPVAVVDRDAPVPSPVKDCWAVGYPQFQEVVSASGTTMRETAYVLGEIWPAENLAGGLLSLHVTDIPRKLPPRQVTLGESQWSGMSGAAVLAGDRLIGVISELAPRRGESSITVTPLAALQRLPAADAARWWTHLAVTDPEHLVTLPAVRPVEDRQVRVGVVPQAADRFQEREEAAVLREAAERDGTVVLTQVLEGMGGVGKTQLAAAHARWAWDEGAKLVMWVSVLSRAEVVRAYHDAAQALALPGFNRDNPERSAQEFLKWTETVTNCWWLVVLDDVRLPEHLNGLWPHADRSAGGGQVVVTTRLREAALTGEGRQAVRVDPFTSEVARSYLLAQLGDRASEEDADKLAEALGRLPLALAQAAAFIRNEDMTVGEYLSLLATQGLREAVPERGFLPDSHPEIVTATWEISIKSANDRRPPGLARLLLQLASVLDSAGIPQQVLASPPAVAYLASARGAGPLDEKAVDSALRVLHRYSLITHDRESPCREIQVHQLVQRAARENLTADASPMAPDPFAALASAAAAALTAVWPDLERDDLGQVLRANAKALDQALDQAVGPVMWNPEQDAYLVLYRAASSLGEIGQFAAARDDCATLYQTALHRLGAEHPGTLRAARSLAHWQGEAGDEASAVAALENLVADHERLLGPDHRDTLQTRFFLAHLRGNGGDEAGAAAESEELVPDYVRTLGRDDPDTLRARNNLGRWQGETGRISDAITTFEELVPDCVKVLGAGDPETLRARHNLAHWKGQAGNPAGAVADFEKIVADCKRLLGPDHHQTLTARRFLAYWRKQADQDDGSPD